MFKINKIIITFLCLILIFSFLGELRAQVEFPTGSTFRYLKGKDAAALATSWKNPDFDDSMWPTGAAPFWYGDGTGGTVLDDMRYNYSVMYFRSSFTASSVDSLSDLQLAIDYDDGFVVWINGQRVLSELAPATLSYNSKATDNHESGSPVSYVLDPADLDLQEGLNTLAVQGFNVNLESSDFHFDIEMYAEKSEAILEDSAGLWFSAPSGFYDSAFVLEIAPADTSWNVIYTIDGSDPQTSSNAQVASDTARIVIDPELPGRPQTPSFLVRASAQLNGIKPALAESRTFIFLHKVLKQSHPGGGWPTYDINEQVMDFAMDNRVVTSPEYDGLLVPALLDLPTISLISGLDHLFDAQSGIYVNAHGHGHGWERECSVELIHPDLSQGFSVNAGLRIRGGWSRHPYFPKHSFRLFFRKEYGSAKLEYPLFGEEGVEQFDKIDLRTSQNYAWAMGHEENTMMRDVFSRDTQRDMGQPYTRSRFYHLYLDGMYWGLYQTQERSEARFAADYFGGKKADYDVIKVDTEDWNYQIEVTDGNMDSWYLLWDMCKTGFELNSAYFKLEGKDPKGEPVPGGQVFVDMDNLIDYMLAIFYTGNFDAPTSSFGWNKGPNNFYAIFNREDKSRGFTFFNHDAEHAMFSEVKDPGTGLYEDRVNLTERTDGKHMEVDHFGSFHPQWLHHKLTANEEYRMRFKDRAYLHLEHQGALTKAKSQNRLNTRVGEIETAIIAESARWGDANNWVAGSFNKNDHWLPQVQKLRIDFIPYRTSIVKDQLDHGGLYPSIDAPVFSRFDQILDSTMYSFSENLDLLIENKTGSGSICYTMDGSDPRELGGAVSEHANVIRDTRMVLDISASAIINARIYNRGAWSALREITMLKDEEDYTNLVFTEIHYHPEPLFIQGDTVSGKDLEFIEMKNTGDDAIGLSGLVLDSAVYYEFPDHVLAPGAFYVLASKSSDFYLRYGLIASGNYKKNLSNGGEELVLHDAEGNTLNRFSYSDDLPWPVEADGDGFSLVSEMVDPVGNPDHYFYWRASTYKHGSPFSDDPFAVSTEELPGGEDELTVYPNPTSGQLFIRFTNELPGPGAELIICGIDGCLIHQARLEHSTSIQLEGMGMSPGLYLLKIRTGNQVFTRKFIYY